MLFPLLWTPLTVYAWWKARHVISALKVLSFYIRGTNKTMTTELHLA